MELENIKKRKFMARRLVLLLFKLFSAMAVGVFIALVGQALINYSYFSFMFIFLTVLLSFWTLVKKWDFLGVLLVDLFFILMIIIVRLYIVISASG